MIFINFWQKRKKRISFHWSNPRWILWIPLSYVMIFPKK